MITDWATIAEPVISNSFSFPSYAQDLQFLSPVGGLVLLSPDGHSLYRIFIDFDGAIAKEFVSFYGGLPPTFPYKGPPFPVFGQVPKDLFVFASGKGIIFPAGSPVNPQSFYRMRIDNDGTPGTEPVTIPFWVRIPENGIPQTDSPGALGIDVSGNWVFATDVIMARNGQGLVMPMRGGSGTRRIRVDFDGDLVSE